MMRWWPDFSAINWPRVKSVAAGIGLALLIILSALGYATSLRAVDRLEKVQDEHEEQQESDAAVIKHRQEQQAAQLARQEEFLREQLRAALRKHDQETAKMLEDLLKRFHALRFEIIQPTPEGRRTIIIQPEPEPSRPGKRKGQS